MPPLSAYSALLLCVLAFAGPLSGQDAHRIWGQVHTTAGDVHEGFIRWDRNEGSWVDILDGSKRLPAENYETWLAANRGGERPTRTIELNGYRISWNEEDPDFPLMASSGILFGHLSSLVSSGGDSAMVVLRSGERLTLSGGRTDIGPSMREVIIDTPGGQAVELEWEDIERVDFSAAPPGALAASPRLYGSVSDTTGRTYTGFISWDLDEIFGTDILDGREENGKGHTIAFSDIRSIEGHRNSATVTLNSGQALELRGTNDVNRGHRGVQVSDPTLGMIELEWEEFQIVRFAPPPEPPAYEAFDGGHLLFGTLTTQEGEEITGRIRWDADEEWSWEFLDGRSVGVLFKVEFARIDRIVRGDILGARVTLSDGRVLELEDSNDVDWDNRGVMVSVQSEPGTRMEPTVWRYISWDDFREIRFEHDALPVDSGAEHR